MMMTRYPSARRDDTTAAMGELELPDPYQWLEDDADEDVAAWQKAQNALAEEALRSWPDHDRLHDAIRRATVDSRMSVPQQHGGRWFRVAVPDPEADHGVLVVSDDPVGDGRVLVDPNALSAERGVPVALDWWYPAPDGHHVAYGLSEGGDEQSVLHVAAVDDGRVLDDRLPHMTHGVVAWLPDGGSFFCNAGVAPGGPRGIVHHRLGDTDPPTLEDVDTTGFAIPAVQVSTDGRYAAAILGHYKLRPAYVRDLANGGGWAPFLADETEAFLGAFDGDRYLAVTTDAAPRGRVVAIPATSPDDRSTWEEVVPEGDAAIRALTLVPDGFCLHELADTRPQLRVFDRDGTHRDTVDLPGPGAVSTDARTPAALPGSPLAHSSAGSSDLTFVYSAVDTAPALYRYRLQDRELERLSGAPFHLEGIATRQLFAESPDGTRVPVNLFFRDDVPLDEPQPTLLYGYGGFNVTFFEGYYAHIVPFLEAGGVYAVAHPRGGGEYGDRWWQQGRMGSKQRTFDDFHAVAEHLIAEGITTPDRLAVMGGSNGGLLTAVAVNQRPDLFTAALSIVPVCDLFRGVKDPYTAYAITNEYGNPQEPEQAAWLAGYSPVHNVPDRAELPAVFIAAGERDFRCPSWHARKLAAGLQHAQTGDAEILLQVQAEAGHGPGKPSSVHIANTTAWMAFVMKELGMRLP